MLSACAGYCDRDRFRVNLALSEAVTNIISYANPDGITRDISLEAEQTPELLTITIADDGRPFDPLAHPEKVLPTRLENAEPGGLGIRLIRRYCDESHYERAGGRNRLTLVFHTIPPGDGTGGTP